MLWPFLKILPACIGKRLLSLPTIRVIYFENFADIPFKICPEENRLTKFLNDTIWSKATVHLGMALFPTVAHIFFCHQAVEVCIDDTLNSKRKGSPFPQSHFIVKISWKSTFNSKKFIVKISTPPPSSPVGGLPSIPKMASQHCTLFEGSPWEKNRDVEKNNELFEMEAIYSSWRTKMKLELRWWDLHKQILSCREAVHII